jgi:imidazolonepropionase-like amidohydrolase
MSKLSTLRPDRTAAPRAKLVDYDLRSLTVMPGWIDAYMHITLRSGRDNIGLG